MTTYNYNSELIKAMNEKLPNGTNLANTLIDMLYLGKEAVYRRLRGEVPFTLAEAAAISQKMGVSLDKLAGTNVDSNAIFDLNIIRHPPTAGRAPGARIRTRQTPPPACSTPPIPPRTA